MMHGHEKSDPAIVTVKPANKAKKSTAEACGGKVAAEPGERSSGINGTARQQSTCRAQNRISVSQALERIRQFAVTHPRVGRSEERRVGKECRWGWRWNVRKKRYVRQAKLVRSSQ